MEADRGGRGEGKGIAWRLMSSVLLIFALAALLFTSCTAVVEPGPTSKPPVSQAPVTTTPSAPPTSIVWSFWGDPWETEANARLIKVFKSDYPGINIETLHAPWTEYFQKAEGWLNSGSPPDIMFFDYIPVYASRGLIEDLTPYIARDSYDTSDFYAGLLKYNTYKGKLYGLSRDNDTKVIFYNKTLFDEAKLPYPNTGWTWDDLRRIAIKLTKKSGDQTVLDVMHGFQQLG